MINIYLQTIAECRNIGTLAQPGYKSLAKDIKGNSQASMSSKTDMQ